MKWPCHLFRAAAAPNETKPTKPTPHNRNTSSSERVNPTHAESPTLLASPPTLLYSVTMNEQSNSATEPSALTGLPDRLIPFPLSNSWPASGSPEVTPKSTQSHLKERLISEAFPNSCLEKGSRRQV